MKSAIPAAIAGVTRNAECTLQKLYQAKCEHKAALKILGFFGWPTAPKMLPLANDLAVVIWTAMQYHLTTASESGVAFQMVDEEKRQQKAMLLLEYQESEENLAHLREKAERISRLIDCVATWLAHAQIPHPRFLDDDRERNANIQVNLDRYQKALNFDEALSLMNDIQQAEKKLKGLSDRKAAIGLK
jgi:hypothetical protein